MDTLDEPMQTLTTKQEERRRRLATAEDERSGVVCSTIWQMDGEEDVHYDSTQSV